MDLKREALTGVAHLATVALTLRRLYQPDFEVPAAMRDSLSGIAGGEVSWHQVGALARSVQSVNAGWSAGDAPLTA